MSLTLKSKCYRSAYSIVRNYCEKSVYQRHEEGPKERTIHGKPYPEWRMPWLQRNGEFRSKLSVFVERNPNPDILSFMARIPQLNMKVIKDWWKEMKELQEIENQKFLATRVATLGSNLAAVHFFTYRKAAVRLKDSKEWIVGDATNLNLPDHFVEGNFVEAVDCTNFFYGGIRYEGLQNLRNLNFLKWLSLKNNKHVDVWCLDRIAGQNGNSLEYLDISGCNLCVGGVFALIRMPALKFLVISDPGVDVNLQAALSMLEQEKPDLLIKAIDSTPNIVKESAI